MSSTPTVEPSCAPVVRILTLKAVMAMDTARTVGSNLPNCSPTALWNESDAPCI